jgi:hypothetical protein
MNNKARALASLLVISISTNAQNSFPVSGNVLLGTSTSNGNLLQVNGNASVNGRIDVGNYLTRDSINLLPYGAYGAGFYIFNTSKIWLRAGLEYNGSTNQVNFISPINGGNPAIIFDGNSTDIYFKTWRNGSMQNAIGIAGPTGYLGIGTITPTAQLHTTAGVRFQGLTADNTQTKIIVSDANGNLFLRDASTIGSGGLSGWNLGGNSFTSIQSFGTTANYDLPIITNNTEKMRVGANGNVGIGTININDPNNKLFVETGIRTRKITVDQATWPDYVFDSTYQLLPLIKLESYIQQYRHLPEIITSAQVKSEGVNLGDNQALMLKKIEELTLYVIEQQKKIDELQKQTLELETLKTEMAQLNILINKSPNFQFATSTEILLPEKGNK